MRKKLLISTALVAVAFTTSAFAETIVINSQNANKFDDNQPIYSTQTIAGSLLDNPDVTIEQVRAEAQDYHEISNGEKLTINQGRLDINGPGNVDHTFTVSGGDIILNGTENIQDDTGIFATGMTVSGGNITLNNSGLTDDGSDRISEDGKKYPASSIDISGGTIEMNSTNGGSSWIDSHGHIEHDDSGNQIEGTREGGTINISDQANIIVNGGGLTIEKDLANSNIWAAKDINMSGGNLTINKNSNLVTVVVPNENPQDIKKSTINLSQNGTINLSGGLSANVNGTGGNLNFNDSASIVDGDVSGTNITFNTDHSLSQAISGTIGNLNSLNINQGNLSFDKQTGLIDNANVAEKAGLDIKNEMHVNNFSSAGKLTLNESINANNDITLSGGSVSINNSEIASWGGNLNISDTELNLSDDGSFESGSGLYARKELNINDGTIINMNGTETVIDNIADYKPNDYPAYDLNINGGTINVQSGFAELSSSANVNLNGGTINVAKNTTLGIYGGNEQKETIAQFGSNAILNLAGTLDTNLTGAGQLNFADSSALLTGDISGANVSFNANHSLSQAISGTIGDLASLNINNASLIFDKQTGTIGNLNVAGEMDIGTNTINATHVDFKDNSSLALRIAATDNFGKINANTINIGDDTTMKVTLDSGILNNDQSETFKFLNGNITGDFTKKIADNNRFDIVWNDDGSLSVSGKDTTVSDIVTDAGGTSSNASTAEAWDSINSSPDVSEQAKNISDTLYTLSQDSSDSGKKAYIDALTAVAPETAPMVQHTQTQTANQVFGAVGTRLTGGSVSTGGQGMSSGDNIFERAATWVQGLFNHSKLDDTTKANGFDADSSGIAMGAEKYVNDDTKIGLGYAYTSTDIDGFMRSTDVDTHTAFVYGEYKPSNWYINGIMSYGWSDYSENKNVSGTNVKADYDAETFGLQAMTGYDIQLQNFGLTPEIGLRYVHISQDGYTDSADQRVSSSNNDVLTSVIGAKISKNFALENGIILKPEARIAATYDLMNDDTSSIITLANGSAYAVEGDALNRFGMEFGAGITADVNDNVELSLGYEGKFREDYQDHTGLLNAKYKF